MTEKANSQVPRREQGWRIGDYEMICRHLITARIVIALLLPVTSLWSQVITGSVIGTVADNTGAGIPNVQMKLTLVATGATRQTSSDNIGNFVFSSVLPGSYTLAIEHPGFKKYEQINVNLSSNERLSLGEVRLELGLLSESVTVTAQSASVQTATAERSGTVTSSQVANLTVINREFTVLATLMPGVVANIRSETQGSGSSAIFYVQGSRGNSNSTLIDGLPVQDLNNGQGVFAFLSIDSVSEVKVLTSSLQAEFGRTSGVNIQAVTKAGTRDFHGGMYWYKRHEMFNANSFFNNRGGLPEARYRFTTAGGNIGGPIYIPGKFNRDRNKLFVFFSAEELREMRPPAHPASDDADAVGTCRQLHGFAGLEWRSDCHSRPSQRPGVSRQCDSGQPDQCARPALFESSPITQFSRCRDLGAPLQLPGAGEHRRAQAQSGGQGRLQHRVEDERLRPFQQLVG